jgi:hypothetical protein
VTDSKNPAAAYANVLDRPPASSYEIMNPHAYEQQTKVPLLNMPDIHPIIDGQYNPYDIGVMGELDVRILAELFGGNQVAADLTPAWDGGIYYAAQKKDATDKDSTASVALFYLSQWKSKEAAATSSKCMPTTQQKVRPCVPRHFRGDKPGASRSTKPAKARC